MLYLIGLGLGDERDITLRGLEAVKKCSKVYLEAYTSILLVDKSKLVSLYQRTPNSELSLYSGVLCILLLETPPYEYSPRGQHPNAPQNPYI